MLYNTDTELILKFLKRTYPVKRTKHNMRFKRSVDTEKGTFFLSDKKDSQKLYYNLMSTLKTVFNTTDELNSNVLKFFLHLK
jgi:hypothetical protein